MADYQKKNIREIDLEQLSESDKVDYSDGDVAIIDNVKDLKELQPLYMRMNFIILCTQGKAQFTLNDKTLTLNKDEVLLSPSNVILDQYLISVDFECKILCLTSHIIKSLLRGTDIMWEHILYLNGPLVFNLKGEEKKQFSYYYDLIKYNVCHKNRRYGGEIMKSIIRAQLLEVSAAMDKPRTRPASEHISQGKQLFERFLSILSQQPVKRQKVNYYASQLAVTAKYLTMVCHKYSGKTASDWINKYVMDDIRFYLKYTELSIKEVAAKMGFSNISFFGTYVRKNLKMSPRQYRDAKLNE